MGGDGQVTTGHTIMKSNAKKIKWLYKKNVLAGCAGATADAFTLFERFEGKLEKHQGNLLKSALDLAKDWRTEKTLKVLDALLIVANIEMTLIVTGQGDVIEPDSHVATIGSGGHYAQAAALALTEHSNLSNEQIVKESLGIAAKICIYTNHQILIETLTSSTTNDVHHE